MKCGDRRRASAVLPPRAGALPDLDLFAILMGRSGGPVRSREILAEIERSGYAVLHQRVTVPPRRRAAGVIRALAA